jgi:hypothetical protein
MKTITVIFCSIWRFLSYPFKIEKETIEGEVVAFLEKEESYLVNIGSSTNEDSTTVTANTVVVKEKFWFIKIRNKAKKCCKKVILKNFDEYKKFKAMIGKAVAIPCKKHLWENIYSEV